MSLVDEANFATHFLSSLSSRAVKYPQDFAPPPQTRQKPSHALFNKSKKSTGKSRLQEVLQNVEPAQEIQVKIKSLKGGQTYAVQLNNSDTILSLKEKLQPLTSISVNDQRLILKGKALIDTKTLYEYGINNDTTIHLVQKSGSTSISSTTSDTISSASSSSLQEPPTLSNSKLTSSAIENLKDSQFWHALRTFLQDQFPQNDDADHVFREFSNIYKEFNGKFIEDFIKTAE